MEDKFKRAVLLIEKYLTQIFGGVRVYREDNEFLIPWGSTVINVEILKEEEDTFIHIYSPVALRVKPDKDLLKFLLAENNSLESCAFRVEFEKGTIDITVGIKLKFDLINKDILSHVAIKVGNLANEYSKEIIAVFGGISFKEYVDREKLEKRKRKEEKILHDIFQIEDIDVALELYQDKNNSAYLILGKVVQTGQVFIIAERKKELNEVFKLMEMIKELMKKKDIAGLKKLLKHYEYEDYLLLNILAGKEKERIKKLKEMEKEIQMLTEMLIKGEISHEDYRKRISDIERQMEV